LLIEVEGSRNSIVIYLEKDYEEVFYNILPFKSKARIWKKELYFPIPTDLKVIGKPVRVHEVGKVYYWPPEKAICIFYGLSEPYTDVYYVGEIIGPLHIVSSIRHGEELIVKEHEISKEYEELVKVLDKELGYRVATPKIMNEPTLVISKYIENLRVAMVLNVENYGIYIESEPIYKYLDDFISYSISTFIRRSLKERYTSARLDLNEDGYVCITGVAKDIGELRLVIREIEQAYRLVVEKIVLEFLGIPRIRSIQSI